MAVKALLSLDLVDGFIIAELPMPHRKVSLYEVFRGSALFVVLPPILVVMRQLQSIGPRPLLLIHLPILLVV